MLFTAAPFKQDTKCKCIATLIFLTVLPCSAVLAASWETYPLRDNGTIPVWTVAGPFPNAALLVHGPGCFGYYKDYLDAVGGERHCVPAEGDTASYDQDQQQVWKIAFSDADGSIDYIRILGVDKETPGVAYAFCQLESPQDKTVTLNIRSNDGVRVWLNDRMVHENHVGRSVDEDEDRVIVKLRQGRNRLLVKVDQGLGGWGQLISLTDTDGEPVKNLAVQVQATESLKDKIRSANFYSTSLVTRTSRGHRQVVFARIVSGGLQNVVCQVSTEEWPDPEVFPLGDLPLGEHLVELSIPVPSRDISAQITLESPTHRLQLQNVLFQKPRKWTLDLVQHTHTDIGYTRPQDELLPAFLRHIDNALDYCDLTDDYPDDARFRWTCEVSWAVREYLRLRPAEQIERLKRRVAEGRIEITALFLNLDELADENVLAASLQPIREFRKQGLRVSTGMQNDVPGVAWCLVDYFNDIGVKYLTMGINNDRTPRPFNQPTAFWWESPSGKRVLAWRPDHYHTGNHLRIDQGDIKTITHKTLEYLQSMENKNYPFDRIAVQYSGMQIDNSPPSMKECDLIRKWNEIYAWPHLRSATAREFPEYVEEFHAEELPVYRGAWPNWWTDGFAFANVETAEAREAHVALSVAQGLLSIASLLGANLPESTSGRIESVYDDLLFYDEHTFGAQEEFSDPMAENSIVQWGEKVSYVWEAVKNCSLLQETAWGLLQAHIQRSSLPTIAVFNTLSWQRSGPVDVYIGHEILPLNAACRMRDAATGKEVPAQVMRSRFEGSYWKLWVDDVPAMGYKTIEIERFGRENSENPTAVSNANTLENEFYRVTVDPDSGAIASLFDRELKRELVARDSPWDFSGFIYDKLTDNHFYDRKSFLERSTRSSLRNVKIKNQGAGAIWKSILVSAYADGCINTEEAPGVEFELRLYKLQKRIDIQFTIRKRFVAEPESVYISFPFALSNGEIAYEAQGGPVTPGKDQLPGSSSDWHTVQNFIAIRGNDAQIIFGSGRIPLVQFGDINMGKWQYIAEIENPYIFSWVMNNYWTYNFRGSKESEFKWDYYITSTENTSNAAASRFGWDARTPLAARVFPANKKGGGALARSTLNLNVSNVLIINARPAINGTGLVLHLRETEGRETEFKLKLPTLDGYRIDRINVLEEIMQRGIENLALKPYEEKFVKLVF